MLFMDASAQNFDRRTFVKAAASAIAAQQKGAISPGPIFWRVKHRYPPFRTTWRERQLWFRQ